MSVDLSRRLGGKIAVVTGGGSGMGRELVRQLVTEGCAVAMCDVSARGMAETQAKLASDLEHIAPFRESRGGTRNFRALRGWLLRG